RQRVVLARGQTLTANRLTGQRNRQQPDDTQDDADEKSEVVGADQPETRRVPTPQQYRSDETERQPDHAERADRHLLALAAERFGHHGGERRQGDTDHWHDGSEGRVEAQRPAPSEETTFWTGTSRSTTLSTAAAVGSRNTFGASPMKIAIATIGPMTSHSRTDRSGSLRFFSLVTSP